MFQGLSDVVNEYNYTRYNVRKFYRGDKFCDILFDFLCKPLSKIVRSLLLTVPLLSEFFPFRVLLQKIGKTNLADLSLMKVYSAAAISAMRIGFTARQTPLEKCSPLYRMNLLLPRANCFLIE